MIYFPNWKHVVKSSRILNLCVKLGTIYVISSTYSKKKIRFSKYNTTFICHFYLLKVLNFSETIHICITYLSTFLGFLDPTSLLGEHGLVLKISQNWHFLIPPSSAYVIYEWCLID